jgi:hypothetical protein
MLRTPPYLDDIEQNNSKKISSSWMAWVDQLFNFLQYVAIDYSGQSPAVPLTGFSITAADKQSLVLLNPAGTLATGTVKTSANPVDGQLLQIASTATVTGFTLSANTGQTVKNPPSTLLAGVSINYFYNAASATWFRIN